MSLPTRATIAAALGAAVIPIFASAQQRFELDDVPNPHRQYALTVDAQAASGIKLSKTETLGFRAVRKAAKPIVADGKIDDALGQDIPTAVRRGLQADDLQAVELLDTAAQRRQIAKVGNKV